MVFYMLLVVWGAVPLVVARVAPLQDWPSHLARVSILDALLGGDPFWAEYYDLNSLPLPNIGMDVGVLALVKLGLSVEAAGTLFLLLVYALFVSGFWMLARACSAATAEKLPLGIFLFYSWALFWGFINYMTGLAAAFWAAALYASTPARVGRKVGLAATAAFVVFWCHGIATAILVLLLACHDAGSVLGAGRFRVRRLLGFAGSASAAVVLLALYASSPTGSDRGNIMFVGSESLAGMLKWKAGLFAKALLGGSVASDAVVAAFLVALLVLAPFVRRVRMPPWAALAAALLAVVALVAPHRIGIGAHVDNRIATVPFLVAAAAARVEWRRAAARRAAFAVVALAVGLRGAALATGWARAGATMDALDAHFASLPAGSVLLEGFGKATTSIGWNEFWALPLTTVATLAARHGVFVPLVYANRSQQPLVLKPRFDHWRAAATILDAADLDRELARARELCAGRLTRRPPPRVEMLVFDPDSYLGSGATTPPLRPLLPRFGVLDMCDANAAR